MKDTLSNKLLFRFGIVTLLAIICIFGIAEILMNTSSVSQKQLIKPATASATGPITNISQAPIPPGNNGGWAVESAPVNIDQRGMVTFTATVPTTDPISTPALTAQNPVAPGYGMTWTADVGKVCLPVGGPTITANSVGTHTVSAKFNCNSSVPLNGTRIWFTS